MVAELQLVVVCRHIIGQSGYLLPVIREAERQNLGKLELFGYLFEEFCDVSGFDPRGLFGFGRPVRNDFSRVRI
jgi:hypothetical protein